MLKEKYIYAESPYIDIGGVAILVAVVVVVNDSYHYYDRERSRASIERTHICFTSHTILFITQSRARNMNWFRVSKNYKLKNASIYACRVYVCECVCVSHTIAFEWLESMPARNNQKIEFFQRKISKRDLNINEMKKIWKNE